MLSSRSIDPPPTLPRLGLQNTNRTTRAAFAAAARPEPASRHTTRIRLISIAKQGQCGSHSRESVLKDTKPKGFAP
jgi:hypothetical protein